MAVLNKKTVGIPPGAVYVGRGSIWGNPFPMSQESDRAEVISKYKVWLKDQIQTGGYSLEQLACLKGKDLVCFCAPKACHGDSLEKVAEWAFLKLQSREN